jgi:hypothetical protein
MPTRGELYRRLAHRLGEELGIQVEAGWEHTRGQAHAEAGTMWVLYWGDGPTEATMRRLVADHAPSVGLSAVAVAALRYVRTRQDKATLALAIAHRLAHPDGPVSEWDIEPAYDQTEHPQRLPEPTRTRVEALYRASGQNLYPAMKAINARPAGELLAWLDELSAALTPDLTAPAGNVIPLHGHRRGGAGE